MGILVPVLRVLPPEQRQVFDLLRPTPQDFVLYGGTALALRLGHRQSVDFDFFSCRPFQPVELLRQIPYLKDGRVIQEGESTLSCEVGTAAVKLSFFGGLSLNQVESPDLIESNGIAVASLRDRGIKTDLLAAVKGVSLQALPSITSAHAIGPRT